MAKPTSVPSWATDTNLATGSESGLSTKLEPSSGVKAQGFVPGEEAPGRWFNWLLNLVAQWCVYLNGLATDTQFWASNFAFTGAPTFAGAATFNNSLFSTYALNISGAVAMTGVELGYADARVRTVHVPLTGNAAQQADGWSLGSSGLVTATSTGPVGVIQPFVPQGAIVSDINASLYQSATATSPVSLGVYLCTKVTGAASTRTLQGSTGAHTNVAGVYVDVHPVFTPFTVGANQWVEILLSACSPLSGGNLCACDRINMTYTETRATGHH